MKLSIFLVILFVTFKSFAATQIKDPNDYLGAVNQYLNVNSNFETAVQCPASAAFTKNVDSCSVSCDNGLCFSGCEGTSNVNYTQSIVNCLQNEVTIVDDLGKIQTLTAQEFSRVKGNQAVLFLENLEVFLNYKGHITIDNAQPGKFKINAGTPEEKTIDVYNINATFYYTDFPTTSNLIITVSKDVPFVAQLMRFRINTSTWFRFNSEIK